MLTVADGTVTGTVEIESIGFCSIRAFREKTAAVAATRGRNMNVSSRAEMARLFFISGQACIIVRQW